MEQNLSNCSDLQYGFCNANQNVVRMSQDLVISSHSAITKPRKCPVSPNQSKYNCHHLWVHLLSPFTSIISLAFKYGEGIKVQIGIFVIFRQWDFKITITKESGCMYCHQQDKPGFHSWLHFYCLIWTCYYSDKDLSSFRMILAPQKLIYSIFQMVS